jgi:CHAD domain-containing protein
MHLLWHIAFCFLKYNHWRYFIDTFKEVCIVTANHVKDEVQSLQEKITYLESVLQQPGVKQCAHKELQVSARLSATIQHYG